MRTGSLLFPVLLASLAGVGCEPPSDPAPSTGESARLFEEGVSFATFLTAADRRAEMWNRNWQRASVPPALRRRGSAVPGAWRLLVVAEDYCGDSANTLPYVARLAGELDNLEVRVVDSSEGRGVMERHPTPDGRAATPTMVLLDGQGGEVGCLVEQPRPLQEWWLGEALVEYPVLGDRLAVKYAWYDEDAGRSTMTEVVELMEAAAAGTPVCRARPGPDSASPDSDEAPGSPARPGSAAGG